MQRKLEQPRSIADKEWVLEPGPKTRYDELTGYEPEPFVFEEFPMEKLPAAESAYIDPETVLRRVYDP